MGSVNVKRKRKNHFEEQIMSKNTLKWMKSAF